MTAHDALRTTGTAYDDGFARIVNGDCRDVLRSLPAESVHCVITSPPYWGLRDYGLPPAIWGGDAGCVHDWTSERWYVNGGGSTGVAGGAFSEPGPDNAQRIKDGRWREASTCSCGAWRGQLGLEPTPDCGRPLMELRPEATAVQREYARQQCEAYGLLDAFPYGMDGRALLRSQGRSGERDTPPKPVDDAHEVFLRADRNRDKSNGRGQERIAETQHIAANDNPNSELENAHPSTEDAFLRQGEGYVAAEPPNAVPPPRLLSDALASEIDQVAPLRSSPPFQAGKPIPVSSAYPAEQRKSLPEPRGVAQHSDGDSSTLLDTSSNKNAHPDPDIAGRTVRSFASTAWAYYILPRNVLPLYRLRLCGTCYVCHMVEVFRELRRVLRPDGTAWLNLAGTYYGSGGAGGDYAEGGLREGQPTWKQGGKQIDRDQQAARADRATATRWKPKDYVPIPWLVALALQADGWWLRSEIIWAKKAPMPESVTDRPTRSHEQVFLLAKSQTYFYDAQAIAERANEGTDLGLLRGVRDVGNDDGVAWHAPSIAKRQQNGDDSRIGNPSGTRNKRDVWLLGPSPYPEAHFATFPPDLVRPCILAGTSAKGACMECGAPWARVVGTDGYRDNGGVRKRADAPGAVLSATSAFRGAPTPIKSTTGWQATCAHEADTVPCTVLDPFSGSGTTCMVAKQLGRRAIGIELNESYVAMSAERVGAVTLPMAGLAG